MAVGWLRKRRIVGLPMANKTVTSAAKITGVTKTSRVAPASRVFTGIRLVTDSGLIPTPGVGIGLCFFTSVG